MTEVHRCLQCGAELARDVAQGLCPKCLLKVGLGTRTDAGDAPSATSPSRDSPPGHPHAAPEVGQSFGPYRLVRLLGRGGMGAVYEAEHLESGRRVALKVLSHSLDSPEARGRFLREGRLAASVNHPNSVYIYGTEEVEGTPAIAMELVPGETLKDRVRRQGPMPVAEAVDAILQIIEGLEAAQALGVLHRDVKPSNCFVEAGGTVKVGDFGLSISTKAREKTHLTTTGTFLGTPAFSSPEQLKGDELDVRSDIYAVGVTLYYLLTGKTPFRGDNLIRFIATALEQPAASPATFRRDIPKGLCAAVLRCLEKQPARRPPRRRPRPQRPRRGQGPASRGDFHRGAGAPSLDLPGVRPGQGRHHRHARWFDGHRLLAVRRDGPAVRHQRPSPQRLRRVARPGERHAGHPEGGLRGAAVA